MTDNHHFDENLRRMMQSALEPPSPEFQERLRREVLAEVARERTRQMGQRSGIHEVGLRESTAEHFAKASPPDETALPARVGAVRLWELLRDSLRGQLKWGVLAGAALIVVFVAVFNASPGKSPRLIGRLDCVYGLVAVQAGEETVEVASTIELKSGQRISTEAGSRAELVLRDQSKVTPDPRTTFRIAQNKQGPLIELEQGRINLEAVKQGPGKFIMVEASGTQVKVLGTKLDIRVVQKPSAERQTVVRVHTGRVEMASAGQSVILLPGMVGVADENMPPVRSSLIFEVDELMKLLEQTTGLAGQSGGVYATPAIIDFTSETVWTAVPASSLQTSGANRLSLQLKYPAFRAKAYTVEGAEIPTEGTGDVLHLDADWMRKGAHPAYVILKVPGVGGMLNKANEGQAECRLPGGSEDLPRLLQLHLPKSANVENLTPAAQSTVMERNRLIVTVLAAVRLPQLHD